MFNLLAQTTTEELGPLEAPTRAFAPNSTATDILGPGNAGEQLVKFLSNFFAFLTTLAGLMFLIYFIFAALSWVTAGGEKGKVETARQQMTNAALGLIIVIAAYGIGGVVGKVVGLDILDPVSVLIKLNPLHP